MELYRLSASEIVNGVKTGAFTCTDVVKSCLGRIKEKEGDIHAMLYVAEDAAIKRAAEIDAEIAEGRDPGPLAGVPVIVKDNICTADMPTTCASRILEDWVPPYDATVVIALKNAGAVIIGKANCDEFAMGGSTEHSAYGPTMNPWDYTCVPGGSSGGSAAAVAAGYAPLALGSDTGGSIRQPAAFCGIYGMKPTYGQVSRYGLVAFASSLDQIGPFARSSEDMRLIMSVLCGFDPHDSTSENRTVPNFCRNDTVLKGKKIGVLTKLVEGKLSPDLQVSMDAQIDNCRKLGAEIVEVSLPKALEYGMACYYILAPAEASSNLARYDGVRYGHRSSDIKSLDDVYSKTRDEGFMPENKRRILIGNFVLSSGFFDAYYLKAQKARTLLINAYNDAFKKFDALLCPVAPNPAFKLGENTSDPLKMYLEDVMTVPPSMAGLPAISVPAGKSAEGLPIGIQLVGPRQSDQMLLHIANELEDK